MEFPTALRRRRLAHALMLVVLVVAVASRVNGAPRAERSSNEVGEEREASGQEASAPASTGILYGDMMLTPQQLLERTTDMSQRISRRDYHYGGWQNNVVPYVISGKYSSEEHDTILRSFREIQLVSCYRFVKRSNQRDYIHIDKLGKGCWSHFGRIGGKQPISLDSQCVMKHIIIHEAMHAIGFQHEHQRPDRDKYIQIIWKNVDMQYKHNFDKFRYDPAGEGTQYDYNSIMHYAINIFGKQDPENGGLMQTIRLKKNIPGGHRIDRMTPSDIKRLNRLGNCSAKKSHRRHRSRRQ